MITMPLLIIIFLIVSHGNWFSILPTFSFIFSWRWCLRWQLKFSLVSPMYTRDINVIIKCVFIILLLICLLLWGRGWGSSQWRTQKGRGKIVFLPLHWHLWNKWWAKDVPARTPKFIKSSVFSYLCFFYLASSSHLSTLLPLPLIAK